MGVKLLESREISGAKAGSFDDALIVDARGWKSFSRGHIPGAVRMGWEGWCEPAPASAGPIAARPGYWGVLDRVDPHRLASYGLSDDRPVVVYADGPRSRGREGRIAWMLLYLGVRDVYLLDGGWTAWISAGGRSEVGEARVAGGRLTILEQPHRRCTVDTLCVAHAGSSPVLVDARSTLEFIGEIPEYLPRRGHLPGAFLVPFSDLFDGAGRYITPERYVEILPPQVQESTDLVAYCEVGLRASVFALLHEAYTGQVVAVYDGSVTQWGLEPDLPLETDLAGGS